MSSSTKVPRALPSPGQLANSSAEGRGFEPLPNNVTFVNATMNGTLINGRLYNTSDSSIFFNGTTIIHTMDSNMIGSVSLFSFIYIIMSCVIIIGMLPNGIRIIRAALRPTSAYGFAGRPKYTEAKFSGDMKSFYPEPPKNPPQPSYPELVDKHADVKWCKTLLRGKYTLDCQATSADYMPSRDVVVFDRLRARSEGAVQELHAMASTWMRERDRWTNDEWNLVTRICERLSTIEKYDMP